MKMNPVYKKELMLTMRSRRIVFKLLAFNSIIAIITMFVYYLLLDLSTQVSVTSVSSILQIYVILAIVEFVLILLIVPASTGGAISMEREKQTFDMLLASTLQPYKIIVGKLLSSISVLLLLIISSAPFAAVVFTIGGITPKDLLELILYFVFLAAFIGSFGIYYSTRIKKTINAIVSTYFTTIALTVGSFFFVYAVFSVNSIKNDVARGAGELILLLLLNPILTFVAMLTNQFGSYASFISVLKEMGTCPEWVSSHWILISILLQAVVMIWMLHLANRRIDPLKCSET
ncbi:hypothetical protein lbkm_2783 [Lachnospiraceae bacterium KM106-2]|nr:hypothetical protein lbkm_2783 [Lachnospiraceae bacterium KM106-2]